MRKLIVVLVLSTLACAQDMTVEQCRADQLLWSHQLDTHTGPRWSLPNLVGRMQIMVDCGVMDPPRHDWYVYTQDSINITMVLRLTEFINSRLSGAI